MKKLLISLLIAVTTFAITNGQFTKAGGGLGYATSFKFHHNIDDANKSGNLNIFVKGIYELAQPIHISGSFTYFLPHITKEKLYTETIKTTVSSMMFDINEQYVFNSLDNFEFYAFGGLNIILLRKKVESNFKPDPEKDNALGFNIGVGTYMKMTEQFDFFGEAKYIVRGRGQFMINAGVLLNL